MSQPPNIDELIAKLRAAETELEENKTARRLAIHRVGKTMIDLDNLSCQLVVLRSQHEKTRQTLQVYQNALNYVFKTLTPCGEETPAEPVYFSAKDIKTFEGQVNARIKEFLAPLADNEQSRRPNNGQRSPRQLSSVLDHMPERQAPPAKDPDPPQIKAPVPPRVKAPVPQRQAPSPTVKAPASNFQLPIPPTTASPIKETLPPEILMPPPRVIPPKRKNTATYVPPSKVSCLMKVYEPPAPLTSEEAVPSTGHAEKSSSSSRIISIMRV